jgi:hypothetical protein
VAAETAAALLAGAPKDMPDAGEEDAPNRPPDLGAAGGVAPKLTGAAPKAAAPAGLAAGAAAGGGLAAPARLYRGSSGAGVGVAAGAGWAAAGEAGPPRADRGTRCFAVVTRMPPSAAWQRCSSCCWSSCQRSPPLPLTPGDAAAAAPGDAMCRGDRRCWLCGVWLPARC